MNKQNIYLISNKEYEGITSINVFDISYIRKDIEINKYDALIYTSKNAIYSVDSFNKDWKNINSYAIAKQTANVINELNGKLVFTGKKSHGNDFAEELVPLLKNKIVLYLRAKKTVSNLTEILRDNNIKIDEEIVYETVCKHNLQNKHFENDSIFIFTSPSSYDCFLENFYWNETFTAIAIGKTTAKKFNQKIKYLISEETSINACIKLAKSIEK